MEAPAAPGTASSAAAWFDQAGDAFGEAARHAPVAISRFSIGGKSVELLVAGSDLFHLLTRPLAHLRDEGKGSADLVIRAWSRSATGIAPPPFFADQSMILRHSRVHAATDDSLAAIFDAYYDQLTVVDAVGGRAVYTVEDESRIPGWEAAAPMRYLINDWFARQGVQMTHAAAVAHGGKGALLAGPGGSGKSTTALRCLLSGELDYLADDYCLASAGHDPMVFSLYSSAKLIPGEPARFPLLAPHFADPLRVVEGEKPVIFLSEVEGVRLRRSAPLAAIYLPMVTREHATRIVPVGRGSSWHSIAPSTMSQLLGSSRRNLELIGRVAASVPAFRIELGADAEAIPHIIAGHLDSL